MSNYNYWDVRRMMIQRQTDELKIDRSTTAVRSGRGIEIFFNCHRIATVTADKVDGHSVKGIKSNTAKAINKRIEKLADANGVFPLTVIDRSNGSLEGFYILITFTLEAPSPVKGMGSSVMPIMRP